MAVTDENTNEESELDRHYRILKRVIMGLEPLADETPEEAATRADLEKEVADIYARGGVPTIPFD
jgi:hypothetical protein